MRRIWLISLLSGFTLAVELQAQIRYLNQVFPRNEIEVKKDVCYGVNATMIPQLAVPVPLPLLMDIYCASDDTFTNRPLVLYFHTGNFFPFRNPDPNSPIQYGFNGACGGVRNDSAAVEICTRLAQMGYVAASCDYRLGWQPTSTIQAIRRYSLINAIYRGIQDASTAVRFFRRSVAEENNFYGIDPNKIVLFGEGTGGNIVLHTAFLDNYSKIVSAVNGQFLWNPQLNTGIPCVPDTLMPMVLEEVNGNVSGTSLGVSPILDPANDCAVIRIDTFCYPNWPNYSSDFNLAVNLSGALSDTSWIDNAAQNAQPALISFHVPNDPYIPYSIKITSGPNPLPPVLDLKGSFLIHGLLEDEGQQDALLNAHNQYLDLQVNQKEAFANSPAGLQDYKAGLYPFLMPPDTVNPMEPLSNAPWEWTSFPGLPPIPGVTSGFQCNTDKSTAMAYIDTIIRFYAPRACFALGLQNCVDQILGEKEPLAKNIEVLVAPNPASDQVRLSSSEEILAIQVIDKTGRLVRNVNSVNNTTYTLQRNGLQSGLYVVKLSFKEGFVTKMVSFN